MECEVGASSCRAGYECLATTSGRGFCNPVESTKAATGSSCSSNSDCATNVCASWPGGYCSKSCTTTSECGAGNVCVREAIDRTTACLMRCDVPDSRSNCRAGYTCIALVGETYGVCGPVDDEPTGAAGGGAGGGAGGAGGGSASPRCRTYATSYTETITTPGAPTKSVTHNVSFDPASRTLTDASTDSTVTQTFATVADFIDMADPLVLLRRGGPSSIRTSNANVTVTIAFAYDAQRRVTGAVATAAVAGSTFEAQRFTYTTWDSYGRGTTATVDSRSPIASEKCIGQHATNTYEDATRTLVSSFSAGTSYSAYGNDNCLAHKDTTVFDVRHIVQRTLHENAVKTTLNHLTTHSTATICL